ncbi:MAG: polysaccharide biosynthesis protein [Candidatus Portnoybacteria bacterium]|nr:polysaccharide biosynthesis protein [Candidatus Portnoybacteria bacterium]
MKVCLTASGGGHLIQLLRLLPILKKHETFFIIPGSHMKNVLKDYKIYSVNNPQRNPFKFILHSIVSLRILAKEKPDVVITNGAGLVVPICFLSKFLFKSKIVFIESFSRIDTPSKTGKIIFKIADLFIVQWADLQKFYGSKAVYGGQLV